MTQPAPPAPRLAAILLTLTLLSYAASFAEEPAPDSPIQPGISGTVSAALLPDGKVALENEFLRFIFDPSDAGAASSIRFKASDKELAVCDTYGGRHFKAFREGLSIQRMREGRIASSGHPYKLVRLEAREGAGVATFAGHPYVPRAGAKGQALAMGSVRLVKTYTLRAASSKLDVGLQAINESKERLPLALWLLSGLRVHEHHVDCFAPYVRGTMVRPDPWLKGSSTFLVVPRPTAPWTAAVGRDPARTGMCIVADDGMVDAVHNWLAKFTGYTLSFGTPQLDVEPGKALSCTYSFLAVTGLPRIDGASRDLACGIALPDENLLVGQPFEIGAFVVSPNSAQAALALEIRRLPGAEPRKLAEVTLSLEPGKTAATRCTATAPSEGTYVVTANLTISDGRVLRVERPLTIGLSAERYRAPRPRLAGRPFWSAAAEGRQPSWMRECDRSIKHPMVPWNVPSAGERLKVLFVGNPGYTTGILRDLARRAGAEWEFVNLCRLQAAAYTTKDASDEPYRVTEQRLIEKKLDEMAPDCVLTAGIQYDNVELSFIEALLAKVEQGMGLVVVAKPGAPHAGPWPAILKRTGVKRIEADFVGLLKTLFDADIAPKPFGRIECYTYGKGRLVYITKQFTFSRGAYSRNDLLPQIRGRTRLPDWEYHFAQYVKAMQYAAQPTRAVRILSTHIKRDAIELSYESGREQKASLEYDLVSADGPRGEHAIRTVTLAKGRHELTLPTKPRPANEYVLHVWLLDGHAKECDIETEDPTALLHRQQHSRPVLDFTAAHCVVEAAVSIDRVTIDGALQAVPQAIHVALSAADDAELSMTVVAEIRNGSDTRVAWRDAKQWDPSQPQPVSFQDLNYVPVAAESVVMIAVQMGKQTVCEKAQRFRRKITGDIAEDEMAFTTTTGVQSDWYVTRVMQKWAVGEAGLDRRFYEYGLLHFGLFGLGEASFPWRRGEGNKLSPPIVDERPLRERLAAVLRKQLEQVGATYFCLQDEFRLGGEYDWSPQTLAVFRQHLKKLYGTVERLNAEWDTTYASFGEATPLLLEDVRKRDNLAPWLDFRLFMDSRVNRRYEIANEEAARISPLIRVGESGMYPPAYDVGVNYYTVAQACRLMMTYAGLRADWVRAFLPDDAVAGVWMGYGSQRPRHPWEALFKGYDILAWWGYMAKGLPHHAMVRTDLGPNRRFSSIGQQQAEIRRGIGKLLAQARPAGPPAYIPYSQVSVYTANALGRDYVTATSAGLGLLRGQGIPCSFIADEQAAAGRLDKLKDKLLVFPGIDAMPVKAAAAYAQAIDRGCFALADAEVAARDGHGKRLAAGPLEAAFGIRRAKASLLDPPAIEQLRWTADASEELRSVKGQMAKTLHGVAIADAVVWASFPDGSPAVAARRSPAGSLAIWLNTSLAPRKGKAPWRATKPEERIEALSPNATIRAIAGVLFRQAGLGPLVAVTPAELKPALATQLVNGRARYYGLLLGRAKGQATITLPQKAHTYEVRSGKYLGEVSTFQDMLEPARYAKVYAQLPYAVRGLSVTIDTSTKRGGEFVKVNGRIEANGDVTECHVIRCEVVQPDGSRPRYHISNLSAPQGRFTVVLPLAVNAPRGEWKIELRDVASSVRQVVGFTVSQ